MGSPSVISFKRGPYGAHPSLVRLPTPLVDDPLEFRDLVFDGLNIHRLFLKVSFLLL